MFKYGGSYSEVFFGYIRRSLLSSQFSPLQTNLTKKQKLLTLILKLGMPYIQKVLDRQYANLNFLKKQKGEDALTKLQQFYIKYFPYFQSFIQLLNFYHNFRYLIDDQFIFYSLFDRLLNQQLYKQPDDNTVPQAIREAFSFSQFTHKYTMFIMFFALQFADFFCNKKKFLNPEQIRALQPCFQTSENEQSSEQLLIKQSQQKSFSISCALCEDAAVQPMCLDVSGFVFCKQCIEQFIRQYGKCPKTGIQCNEKNLHKIITDA